MRTRAIAEPSAGLMEHSSPPEGLAIHSPSQAPELSGSISKRSSISSDVAVAIMIVLRKPRKGLRAGSKSAPGSFGPSSHSFGHRRLKSGVVPFSEIARAADAHGRLAGGRTVLLYGADVKWIADDIAIRCIESQVDERLRIAGQQRRQRGVGWNAGCAQAPQSLEALGNGRAVRLVQAAHRLEIGGDREAHAHGSQLRELPQPRDVPQYQRAARL